MLFQLCTENFLGEPVQKYYYYVQKYCLFGLRAEILLTKSQGLLESHSRPFLGSVKKYWFFGEIFTSEEYKSTPGDYLDGSSWLGCGIGEDGGLGGGDATAWLERDL